MRGCPQSSPWIPRPKSGERPLYLSKHPPGIVKTLPRYPSMTPSFANNTLTLNERYYYVRVDYIYSYQSLQMLHIQPLVYTSVIRTVRSLHISYITLCLSIV